MAKPLTSPKTIEPRTMSQALQSCFNPDRLKISVYPRTRLSGATLAFKFHSPLNMKPIALEWDVFCQVIDNHGDLGVCWRLARRLGEMGHSVRLFIDDASALSWMAPQGHPNVQCKAWPKESIDPLTHTAPDVLIEAFGCEVPQIYLCELAHQLEVSKKSCVWINLEYLSAEDYVERTHLMPSPVSSGPMQGQTKWFFYPGFTPKTGGLLKGLNKSAILDDQPSSSPYWVLFCYEPTALSELIRQLSMRETGIHLKVTAGRAQVAIRTALKKEGVEIEKDTSLVRLGPSQIEFLPYLSQLAFDDLLERSELNFVRGEDSWVRAIWAQKPFIWQIYPQSDLAHETKLMAFLSRFEAPRTLIDAHLSWNSLSTVPLAEISLDALTEWRQWSEGLGQILNKNSELATSLEHFVLQKLGQLTA